MIAAVLPDDPVSLVHADRKAARNGRERRREFSRRWHDGGSMTVELVVLTPMVVVFLLFTLAMGRDVVARDQVASGARAAAEAASVAPSLDQAQSAAVAAASPILRSVRSCREPSIVVTAGAFAPGAEVRAVVSCQVDFSDLLVPGMPGSTTVSATETAVIDPYRAVAP
jgi:Flp pilus assembly protein TadG